MPDIHQKMKTKTFIFENPMNIFSSRMRAAMKNNEFDVLSVVFYFSFFKRIFPRALYNSSITMRSRI